jgi:4-hydroxy-3-polyprenylbenzoate decarboxylase
VKQAEAATIALAITGASGAAYGLRLLEQLLGAGQQVHLMLSAAGLLVLNLETELALPAAAQAMQERLREMSSCAAEQLRVFGIEDWSAPAASGSGQVASMVVCPCTTGTLSAIANGASNNLIERAADVILKEGRKLILVPRETPLSAIHLQNMLALARLGAVILPASPGFYHRPTSVQDLVDFLVARILDQLGIGHRLIPRWGE